MEQKISFFVFIFAKFGWLGNWLFLFIALAECIPFVGSFFPGGTLIFIASFLAAHGYLKVQDIFIFATLGAIIGDYAGYLLGRWGRPWLEKKRIFKPELIVKGEDFFRKYGNPSIFWGRFFGPLRSVIPFTAGATGMKQSNFLLWNILGALGWAAFNIGLGYFSGNIIAILLRKWSRRLGLVVALGAVLLLIYWLVKKHGQSAWQYFKLQSNCFANWLLRNNWFNRLDDNYPVVSEFFTDKKSQDKIFGLVLGLISLITLYLLTIILDIF